MTWLFYCILGVVFIIKKYSCFHILPYQQIQKACQIRKWPPLNILFVNNRQSKHSAQITRHTNYIQNQIWIR